MGVKFSRFGFGKGESMQTEKEERPNRTKRKRKKVHAEHVAWGRPVEGHSGILKSLAEDIMGAGTRSLVL